MRKDYVSRNTSVKINLYFELSSETHVRREIYVFVLTMLSNVVQ